MFFNDWQFCRGHHLPPVFHPLQLQWISANEFRFQIGITHAFHQFPPQMMAGVRRQHLWDQIGDLNNGGFLAHRNPKESEDEPEILRPTHAGASLSSPLFMYQ